MKKYDNSLFKKHRSRLVKEGIIRAVTGGLAIGSAVTFIASFAAWFFDFGGMWMPAVSFILCGAVAAILLYFVKYRPDEKDVARRIDGLGLEERAITMLELQDDGSDIAVIQRNDAKRNIENADKKIKFKISRSLIAFAAVAFVFSVGMITVAGLAAKDIIPSGMELIDPPDPDAGHVTVNYSATVGGKIVGASEQLVLIGGSAESVVAVADYGYIFVGWSDGLKSPARQDEDIQSALDVTAIFEEFASGEDDGEDEGDEAGDIPSDSEMNQSGSSQGGTTDGDNSDPDSGEEEDGNSSDDSTGIGSAGKWEDGNQFIDGETYYRDYLDIYYEMAMKIFEETGEIPPEMREFFEKYFGGI